MKGYFDIHNHILPGLDDGSSCLEETLMLIESEYEQGVSNIIFTPHYRVDMFEVPVDEHKRIFDETISGIKTKFPAMNFYLGCEFHLDSKSFKVLNPSYCLCGTNILLVEFDYGASFSTMVKLLREVLSLGIIPIIAHVERYDAIVEDISRVMELRSMNCKIQINADAVIGKNGFSSKRLVNKLLKMEAVDFVASDAHNIDARSVRMGKAMSFVIKKYGEETKDNLFRNNIVSIFEGVDKI